MTVSYKGERTLVGGSGKTTTSELQAKPAKFLLCIPEKDSHSNYDYEFLST